MPKFKAIFFDLDGTLWDTGACADHALDIVIEQHMADLLPDAEPEEIKVRFNAALLKQLHGGRLSGGVELLRSGRFRTLLEGYGVWDDALTRQLTATYNKALRMTMETYVRDGVPEILRCLRQAGIVLGILTSGTPAPRRRVVKTLGVEDLVDHLLIAEVEGYTKPDPRLFGRIVDLVGAPRQQILYVGDNPITDVLGARRAGIPVAWLREEGQMLPEGVPEPDYVLESLHGIIKIAEL